MTNLIYLVDTTFTHLYLFNDYIIIKIVQYYKYFEKKIKIKFFIVALIITIIIKIDVIIISVKVLSLYTSLMKPSSCSLW